MATAIVHCHGFNIEYFKNDALGECIAVNKKWEPHVTTFVSILKDKMGISNIIDVGANFGYHTLFFSKIVGENGKVFAFEPQQQTFTLLSNNIQNNNINNVEVFNHACSDEEGFVYMPLFKLPLESSANLGDITPNCNIDVQHYHKVESVILDKMNLPKIDFIKIDVQGWEAKVIHGLKNIICKDFPILVVEFEFFQLAKTNTTCKQLAELLQSYGYYIYYLQYEYPSDHICVHENMLNEFNKKFSEYIFNHNEFNEVNNNISYNVCKKLMVPYATYIKNDY
jgi:FkbM family methyltransferase